MSKEIESALESQGMKVMDELPTNQPQADSPAASNPEPQPEAQPVPTEPEIRLTDEPPSQWDNKPQEAESPEIDIDQEVLSYLSEKLGRNFESYDTINDALSYTPVEIDERVSAINKFVLETGRSVDDWYRYQSLDPSEMDDASLVRLQLQAEHSNLASEDIDLLMKNKYKLDENYHSEDEVKLSQLQLKMDAEKARKYVGDMRDSYAAPSDPIQQDNPIDESWISEMTQQTNSLGTLDFDLPGKNEMFSYGITDEYRSRLIDKNSKLDTYFDDYIQENGSWDFDKLNAHRALVDNIDSIVSAIYSQGLSDGRMGVVQSAANVSGSRPQVSPQDGRSSLEEQLLKALSGDSTLRFNS